MKKFKLLFFALLVATTGFFSSCEKDESGPSLDFFGGEFIDGNTTVDLGATLNFKITATSTTDMATIEVEMTGYGVVWDDEILSANENSYTKEISIIAPSNAGTYTYVFTIFDSEDIEIVTKSIVITVAPALTEYTNKTLGSFESATGSSFASLTGDVYTLANAKTNASKVDFLFFYGATNAATLAAPNDADAATIYNSATNGLQTWSVKNATKLKKVTGITYASVTASQIPDVATDGSSKVNTLAVGDLIAFKTASTSANASKKGIIKINAITGTAGTATINYDVKVQH